MTDWAPWLSRLAALLVLVLGLGLVHAGVLGPYLDHVGQLDAHLSDRAAVLARMQALTGGPAPAPAPTAAATAPAGLLLPDLSDAQAVGALQDRLKEFAGRDGLELQNVQVLPRTEQTAIARLSVRLRAVGDMAAINRFLHAVEADAPVLLVDNLRIQSRTPRGAPATGGGGALDVQLDVIGFKAEAS